jgi:NADPH2:quinone reductase
MRAIYIVKEGDAQKAFEIREVAKPEPGPGEVRIKVEAFGLNFADTMARKGRYPDRPALPCVVGYDVCGHIDACGADVSEFKEGDRVAALTRFGGYAEYAITDSRAIAKIGEHVDAAEATALGAQYCTAWYAAEELINMFPGDNILIHAAAGGVGTALVQIAQMHDVTIFGTAGSDEKIEMLRKDGVQYPINYRKQDWVAEVRKVVGSRGLDVIFDSVGAQYFKEGKKLLGIGGRIVGYGAADMSDAGNIFTRIKKGLAFGIYHPVQFLRKSQSMIGVYALPLADERPEVIARCLKEVAERLDAGIFKPKVGARFMAEDIAKGHEFLESRKSIGKIAHYWDETAIPM